MTLFDISDEQLQGALPSIRQQLTNMEKEGLLREGQLAAELAERVTLSSNLQEAMAGAVYVQVG